MFTPSRLRVYAQASVQSLVLALAVFWSVASADAVTTSVEGALHVEGVDAQNSWSEIMELDGEKLEIKEDETADLAFEIVTWNPHRQLRQVTHTIHALMGEGGNVYDVKITITAVTNRPLKRRRRCIVAQRLNRELGQLLQQELTMFEETKSFKKVFERLERDHGGSGSTEMRSSKKVVRSSK